MTRPDREQEAVLASRARHIVVVAPPGTGKTTLAARLAGRDAAQLEAHERVLVLTFSNQARGRLEAEVRETVPRDLRNRIEVTNYHRFFWTAVRDYRRALGLPEPLRLSSLKRRLAILRSVDRRAVDALSPEVRDVFAEQAHPDIAAPLDIAPDRLARLLQVVREDHERGRVTFGDFGALFWTLLRGFPVLAEAYAARYPVVIADEHQDASGLQDAVVRRFGSRRQVIFADGMQLIYGWRGARPERLEKHVQECDDRFVLSTAHRWHGDPATGEWLLGFRRRLLGEADPAGPGGGLRFIDTDPVQGENGIVIQTRFAVLESRRDCSTLVVLTRTNGTASAIRNHLDAHGLRPLQLGASDVVEESLALSEELTGLAGKALARRVVDRVAAMVPRLEATTVRQVTERLDDTGVRRRGAGRRADVILAALEPVYGAGPDAFFGAVATAVEGLRAGGLHVPRPDELALYQAVARATVTDLNSRLELFSQQIAGYSGTSRGREASISVMTAHQAKGREFDGVIIAGASADRRGFSPADEEARRLFYVAITRGRKRWTVIAPRGRRTPFADALLP